jgi:hypothetical protein
MGSKFNKELPRDLQVKTILQNFDKKQAECDALKKENAELKKKLEQKEILYRNMLNRYSNMSGRKDIDYKEKYEQLKAEKSQSGERYTKVLNKLAKASNLLESVKSVMNSVEEKINDFCDKQNVMTAETAKDVLADVESLSTNTKERQFIGYIRELIANFKDTGSLRGISTIAREYGVSSLTKEQFFKYGLDSEEDITDEIIISVYDKAKKYL